MSAVPAEALDAPRSPGRRALARLRADRWAMLGLAIVALFFVIALGVWAGWWGGNWMANVGERWEGPSSRHWLGTTILGQDILDRALYSTRTAFEIGLIVALASTVLGALFGALSGYFAGSLIDSTILWLKGVLDAIPFYLFVAALAFALKGNPWAMHIAMVATFWTTTARLVRGEVIKLKELEFVEAARAIGLHPLMIIYRHILPNTFHILLVQATIVFVAAIKSEVILSFLGLGVQDGVSWGLMIAESTTEVTAGHYMNFIAASSFLFVLVMGFNLFADGLQDALDPKRGGRST
ncbi:MAG: ABC transporter permease [Gammaproteobacteria bacterium HGW-Gammaproteobacteria-8]|nr:MAG: ABC transporter permease [Gammaproteobacteria bacterium HGW-Gammaproteobacteria-8]